MVPGVDHVPGADGDGIGRRMPQRRLAAGVLDDGQEDLPELHIFRLQSEIVLEQLCQLPNVLNVLIAR